MEFWWPCLQKSYRITGKWAEKSNQIVQGAGAPSLGRKGKYLGLFNPTQLSNADTAAMQPRAKDQTTSDLEEASMIVPPTAECSVHPIGIAATESGIGLGPQQRCQK